MTARSRWSTDRLLGATALALLLVVAVAASGCSVLSPGSTASSGGAVAESSGKAGMPDIGNAQRDGYAGDAAVTAPGVAPSPPLAGSGTDASKVPIDQKLIVRNKTIRVEVKDVAATIASIRELAKRDKGDITQLQVATASDEPIYRPVDASGASGSQAALRAFVTVRVPADSYEAFIADAAKLGDVKFQSESTDDVTQQHIDLKARLDNLRAEEAQLREFFLKAKNVTEMLQIEQELSRVRGEIESMAAQVSYLERQAAMATVTLELTEPPALVRPSGYDWGVAKAFTQSVRAFVGTLNVLIIALGPALAFGVFVLLPAWLIVWTVLRVSKRRREKRAIADEGAAPSSETGDADGAGSPGTVDAEH